MRACTHAEIYTNRERKTQRERQREKDRERKTGRERQRERERERDYQLYFVLDNKGRRFKAADAEKYFIEKMQTTKIEIFHFKPRPNISWRPGPVAGEKPRGPVKFSSSMTLLTYRHVLGSSNLNNTRMVIDFSFDLKEFLVVS
ncbi:hypothetical protein EVAR_66282_1 [Eumeta japonica]|uniref:Uncharacterized protein n=1 Tax=Eumeta variegata TaxID=151549 RepID=A0A4C1YP57_EUMVA|nr:hypothetical protein EVAR_66282_1 [Eumeta japonica]